MKVVLYGGAFNPFHTEHKRLIETAINEVKPDLVVVYPSFNPPHKNEVGDFDARFEMCKVALKDITNCVIEDIEKKRNKVNPSFEIIPILKEKYLADEYYFLMGGDSLINFNKWLHPELVAKEVTLLVGGRSVVGEIENAKNEVEKKYNAKVKLLDFVGENASGSIIKAKIEWGEKPEEISSEVYEVIKKYGLYSEYAERIKKLKETNPKRFEHVKRTTLYALKLNTKLGLDFDKVFAAGMFHDCAKHLQVEIEGVPEPVVHQFVGKDVAKNEYGILDEEVLNAICYHTTGRPNMSLLEKLIYCADMLEEGRTYPGVEELRKTIENDFEKGFVVCVNAAMDNLKQSGNPIHPLTIECVEYYNLQK